MKGITLIAVTIVLCSIIFYLCLLIVMNIFVYLKFTIFLPAKYPLSGLQMLKH